MEELKLRVITVVTLLFLGVRVAPAESQSGQYNGGSAYAFGLGAGFVLLPDGRDLDRGDQTGVQPIGGVTLRPETGYRNVVVRIDDEIFRGGVATDVCMAHPGGDLIYNGDDSSPASAAGRRVLHDAPEPHHFVIVFT